MQFDVHGRSIKDAVEEPAIADADRERAGRSSRRSSAASHSSRSHAVTRAPPCPRRAPRAAACSTCRRACRADRWRPGPADRVRPSRAQRSAGGSGAASRAASRAKDARSERRFRWLVSWRFSSGIPKRPGRSGASRSHRAATYPGAPATRIRLSPTSAPSRAVSVASVSGDGIARSSSEYWTMRAGAGSISIGDDVDAGGRRMRLEIEQQQRPQHLRDRASRPAAAARAHGWCDRRAGDRAAAPRRRDRHARAPPTTDRAGARARTTAARARRSATRAPSTA